MYIDCDLSVGVRSTLHTSLPPVNSRAFVFVGSELQARFEIKFELTDDENDFQPQVLTPFTRGHLQDILILF